MRWGWRAGLLVALALLLASTEIAVADEKTPSARKVAQALVQELGRDAIPATALALDRGYDADQLIEAAIDVLLDPSGLVNDDSGNRVKPARPPAGVITDTPSADAAGDGSGVPVSIESVRDAVPRKKRVAINELMHIFIAVGRG